MLFLFLGRCWFVSTNQSFPRNLQIQNQANSILKPNLILLFFQFSACTITSNCMRLQFVTDRHKLIRQTNKLRVTISEMSSAEWSWNAPKMNVCQVTSFITEAHKKKYISQKPPWRREKNCPTRCRCRWHWCDSHRFFALTPSLRSKALELFYMILIWNITNQICFRDANKKLWNIFFSPFLIDLILMWKSRTNFLLIEFDEK